ncbi:MAG: response regulator transcription factor [Rhodothermales bacterium]
MSTPPTPVRVVLAEPFPLLRDGLACLLEQHPAVVLVGEASEAGALRHLRERLAPDVILSHPHFLDKDERGTQPDSSSEGATGEAFDELAVRVVALVDEAEPVRRRVLALLDDGVAGFVSTRDDAETVLEAVCVVAQGGEVYLSPRVAARLAPPGRRRSEDIDEGEDPLTPREREVLACAALGYPNARIADELGLAPGTVRNHLSAAYAKLGARTRGEAVVWAWRYGLIDLPPAPDVERR